LYSIDVGTLILASPGLHAQVAGYEMMNCLSDKKTFYDQGYPLSVLISQKYPKIRHYERRQ
jgi:hypothetical protein